MAGKQVPLSQKKAYRLFPSVRLSICVLGFFGITVCATLYSSLHFAWVCMVNATNAAHINAVNEYNGHLNWGKEEQRFMFAAYSFGGIFLTLPAGWLTDRFGAKHVLASAVLLSSVSTLLIPVSGVSSPGKIVVVFLRVMDGIGGSVMWPALYSVCSHWAAKKELGLMLALILSGLQAGQFINMILSGVFCRRIAWQFIFYFWGSIGVFFSVFWFLVYRSDPEDMNSISKGMIFIFIGCMELHGFKFLRFVHHIHGQPIHTDIHEGSIAHGSGKKWFRQVFNTVALMGAAACTLGLTFVSPGAPQALSVFLLCATLFFMSFSTGGYYKCPLYIAPQFSGTVGALSTISGFIATILLPYIVTAMTPNGSEHEWRSVFYTAVGLGIFGSVFFLIFGRGDLQAWARAGKEPGVASIHPLPAIRADKKINEIKEDIENRNLVVEYF